MNRLERLIYVAVGLFASHKEEAPAETRPAEADGEEVINDAAAYGVRIEPARVAPGQEYWRAERVHHLAPEENAGKHHVYLDVYELPEAGKDAGTRTRLAGARLKLSWDGGEEVVTIDRPEGEPGTNFPLWKYQVVAVEALGLPGENLPSDRVTGLTTEHPDEGPGNTLFHHSFHVTFLRARAPQAAAEPTASRISGRVRNGAGRVVVLSRNKTEVARRVVDAAEAYEFRDLPAGAYQVWVPSTGVTSEPQTLDGANAAAIDLVLPPAGRPLAHYVLFGPPGDPATQASLLLARDYLLTFMPSFGFDPAEAAAATKVTIIGNAAVVSEVTEMALRQGGALVQRIQGSAEEVARDLAERVARGKAF